MTYPYVPAKYQWPRRVGYRPTLLVIHSMEAPEKGTTAESCANYFRNPTRNGKPVVASAHLCIDNNSVVQSVPFHQKAAGAAGGPYRGAGVNDSAIHLEHAGYARQTAHEWNDQYSQSMLFWSAISAAQICATYDIPAVKLSPHELRIGKSGICTHKDITDAFYVSGGHTDPGPAFPMNSYIANVNHWLQTIDPEEDDMYTDADRARDDEISNTVKAILKKVDAIYVDTHGNDHPELLAGQVKNIAVKLGVPTS